MNNWTRLAKLISYKKKYKIYKNNLNFLKLIKVKTKKI